MRSSNSKVLQIVSKRLEHQQSAANSPEMLGFVSKLLQGRKRGLQGDISFFWSPVQYVFFVPHPTYDGMKVIYICLTPQKSYGLIWFVQKWAMRQASMFMFMAEHVLIHWILFSNLWPGNQTGNSCRWGCMEIGTSSIAHMYITGFYPVFFQCIGHFPNCTSKWTPRNNEWFNRDGVVWFCPVLGVQQLCVVCPAPNKMFADGYIMWVYIYILYTLSYVLHLCK